MGKSFGNWEIQYALGGLYISRRYDLTICDTTKICAANDYQPKQVKSVINCWIPLRTCWRERKKILLFFTVMGNEVRIFPEVGKCVHVLRCISVKLS